MKVIQQLGADDAPTLFYKSTLSAFERARDNQHGCVETFFALGPHTLRVSAVGDVLAEKLTRALSHLVVPPSPDPTLTVFAWDDAGSDTKMPPPPWDWQQARLRHGAIADYNTERIYTTYDAGADALEIFDAESHTALYWTRDARGMPGYEYCAPLRTILHWALQAEGELVLHSGAVGNSASGVLLAGKGGSGKSTSALACLVAGMEYVSDDYCLVTAEPAPYAYNIYNSAKVTAKSLELVPSLESLAAQSTLQADDKTVLFLDETPRVRLIRGLTLRAVLLPRVTGRAKPRLVPTASNTALSALAVSTLFQLPNAGNETLRGLGELTAQLPCFVLELGNAADVPRVLQAWLAGT